MKILIVDDQESSSKPIKENICIEDDIQVLVISDSTLAIELVGFGVPCELALLDLQLDKKKDSFGGLAVCEKIRRETPAVVIIGYSSSFSGDTPEDNRLKLAFRERGANDVWPLEDLQVDAASELKGRFEQLIEEHKEKIRSCG